MISGKHNRTVSLLRCVFGHRVETAIVRFRKSRAKQLLQRIQKQLARMAQLSAELATRGALVAGTGLLLINTAFAQQPTGADVVAGSAVINVSPTVMNVDATSARTIINWDQFSIGAGNTANFNLPDASSAILNRVTSADMPSIIAGALNSNGHVHLVNPSGIMIGASGVINTNAFVASTFDISNSDFLKGGALTFSDNGANASIVNQGDINTGVGGAHLIANSIANIGTITSVGGNITMSGGGEVTLSNGVNYVQPTLDTLTSGISPTAGLIKNTGSIRATGAATSGGEVYLVNPSGKILHDGTIAAQTIVAGSQTTGGHVQLEADDIRLSGQSSIDVTGTAGGGDVLVGGDWQGSGAMNQAATVTMLAGAIVDASATLGGDGGKIVLWADVLNVYSVTTVAGTLLAKAADLFGNGGQIETSGATVHTDGITVNGSAANGDGGLWLIDPYDYVIDAVAASNIVGALNTGTSVEVSTAVSNTSQGGSVTNTDAGDITLNSDIVTGAMTGDATLTLKADRHIILNNSIDATQNANTNALTVQLLADSDDSGDGINIFSSANIKTNGGSFTAGDGSTATIGGVATKVGGDIYINGMVSQTIDTAGGAITIHGETIVANSSASGVKFDSNGGDIVFGGLLNSGNQYTYVDGPDGQADSWNWSRTDAKNGTAGGSALGDSYLVTITSRLENAIAGISADYRGAWIGAYRPDPAGSYDWQWADGAEGGQSFFTQVAGGGGSAVSGGYANFGVGEPNGGLDATGEQVGQFFGNEGQWNDLSAATIFDSTQASQYSVLGYVRETNLSPTAVTIDAGATGTVSMGGVGSTKALASLNVTSAGVTINGDTLVTTGVQSYDSFVNVISGTDLQIAGSSITLSDAGDNLLLKADGNVNVAASTIVETNGGDITFWSDADETDQGYILVEQNVTLDTRTQADRTATTHTTGGGNITLAGGADNGSGAPAGFANADSADSGRSGVSLGNNTAAVNNVQMFSGGGDVLIKGQADNSAMGVLWIDGGTLNAGSTGLVNIQGENLSSGHGVELGGYNQGSSPIIRSGGGTVAEAAVQITGTTASTTGFLGVQVQKLTVQADGTGGIAVTGSTGSDSGYGVGTFTANLLSASGDITVDGGEYGVAMDASIIGRKAATSVLASSSDVDIIGDRLIVSNANSIATSGTVTVQPSSTSFSSTLNWPFADLSLSTDVSGLTLGNVGNGADITVSSAVSIAGAIQIYGDDLSIEADLTSGATSGTGVLLSGETIVHEAGVTVSTNGGDIEYTAAGLRSSGSNNYPLLLEGTSGSRAVIDAAGGDIRLNSSFIGSGDPGGSDRAIQVEFSDIKTAGAGTITIVGDATNNSESGNTWGFQGYDSVIQTESGAIDITATGGKSSSNSRGFVVDGSAFKILSESGAITIRDLQADGLTGTYTGFYLKPDSSTQIFIGADGSAVAASSSDILIQSDRVTFDAASGFGTTMNTSGDITIESVAASFAGGVNVSNVTVSGGPSGLRLGKTTNTTNITTGKDISVTGVIQVYGGTLSINADLSSAATSGTGVLLSGQRILQDSGVTVSTDGADIEYVAAGYTSSGGAKHPIHLDGASGSRAVIDAAGGDISLNSSFAGSTGSSGSDRAITVEFTDIITSGTGTITIVADATNNTKTDRIWGFEGSDSVFQTESGAIDITATGGKSSVNSRGFGVTADKFKILSESGSITIRDVKAVGITGTYTGLFLDPDSTSEIYIGADGSTVASSTSDILIQSDLLTILTTGDFGTTLKTTGGVVVESVSNKFSASAELSNVTIADGPSSLRFGKTTNTASVTTGTDITVAGDVEIYGGSIAINGGLTATGTNRVSIVATGSVADGTSGFIKADEVAIDAGGSTTLNSSSNEFGTFAFDGTSLAIVESDGLTVGTVGSLDGIAATNTVDISTLTGDLTIASDIATTKGGNSALTLNAGKDAAAGTAAGGNIIVTNSATVAVGSGGTAKLYSGDISGSTGLTNLIGSGSGKFRYNSDESASNFTLALESGVNAIYREQPTVTVTADDASAVYGSAPTLTTSVNSQNGDTVVQILGSSPAVSIGGATSTSGNDIAGDHVLTAAAATDQLGYSITGYTAGTLSVTVKALSLAGSILDKVYDGTDVATSGTSLSGLLSGDVVSLLGTMTFDTKNVGTDKTVTIIGATVSGADAANYSIAASGSDTADITVKSVTVSGIAAANRVYDRTTVATVDHSGVAFVGMATGDDLTASGTTGTFDDKIVGTGKTVTLADTTYGGTDVGNYSITDQTSTTADITAKSITVSGITAANRIYDGTTAATVDLSGVTFDGIVSGDDLTASDTTGTFDSKDLSTSKTVTLAGTTYGGTDLSNYSITDQASALADITPKAVTVGGLVASNKVYDGITAATVDLSGVTFGGIVTGDDLSASGTIGTFDSKNASTGKTVTLADTTYGGTDVGNYSITDQTSTSANITAKSITVGGITAANRIYDGTTTATVDLSGVTFGGIVTGDDLSASGTTGTFDSKNVSTGKTVTLAGTTYGGTDLGNYSITDQASALADITSKAVAVGGLVANNKVYDGITTATVDLSGVTFNGIVSGDTLTASGTTGTFGNKNVGNDKTVTLAGTTYGGTDLANYSITGQASALADITPKAVAVGGLVVSNKVYDGITAATVDLSGVTFSGIVSGDSLTASDTTGTFGNKNVGTDKTVTLTGTTYGGTDSANYSFTDQASALANISVKSITVSGIAAGNRVYDGTTVAAVDHSGVVFNGMVSGDSLTASDTTGTFSNKNVGNAKAVTLSGTTYGGTDVGNYSLTDQTSTTANITAKPITVSGVRAVDRVYDGTLIARINRHGVTFNGIVSGDDLTASDTTGTYADKNVGTDKTVTLAGTTYGGTDLSNYSITDQASAVADITPKSVTVGGLVANDKVYDGTRAATVDHSGVTFDGIIAGDELTAADTTGTFAVKDVFYYDEFGDDKDNRVVLDDTTYGGADVGNYTFDDQSASVAAITPKPLTIRGLTADDKVYDGTTTATFDSSGVVYDGLVDGDDVVGAFSGTYVDKNAGVGKGLNVALAVSGDDVDNYSTSYTEAVTADIFRLDSVTWIGGLTGDWSDPANWAGGAIPDFANVANVIIPTAATPTFDGSVPGPVEIDSVTGGNLQIDSGTLNVANDVALDNYIQNGGAFHVGNDFNVSDFVQHDGELTIGNDFQVTNSFYQSLLSTITVTADTDVYHTTGDLTVANLSGDNITLKSTNGGVSLGDVNALGTLTVLACDGDIDQLEETAVAVGGDATFEATGDITLTDKSNNFTGTVNACGDAVNIDDADNRLQFGVFKAADKDEALMDIVSSAVRDTNTRYLIDETSTDTGSPAVSQRFGQGPQTGATNGLDGSSESAPVLTEQNIQDVEGEVRILDGEPSKLSQSPGETVIQ